MKGAIFSDSFGTSKCPNPLRMSNEPFKTKEQIVARVAWDQYIQGLFNSMIISVMLYALSSSSTTQKHKPNLPKAYTRCKGLIHFVPKF